MNNTCFFYKTCYNINILLIEGVVIDTTKRGNGWCKLPS